MKIGKLFLAIIFCVAHGFMKGASNYSDSFDNIDDMDVYMCNSENPSDRRKYAQHMWKHAIGSVIAQRKNQRLSESIGELKNQFVGYKKTAESSSVLSELATLKKYDAAIEEQLGDIISALKVERDSTHLFKEKIEEEKQHRILAEKRLAEVRHQKRMLEEKVHSDNEHIKNMQRVIRTQGSVLMKRLFVDERNARKEIEETVERQRKNAFVSCVEKTFKCSREDAGVYMQQKYSFFYGHQIEQEKNRTEAPFLQECCIS